MNRFSSHWLAWLVGQTTPVPAPARAQVRTNSSVKHQSVGVEAFTEGRRPQERALPPQRRGRRPVGGLKFRPRPERGGQQIPADDAI